MNDFVPPSAAAATASKEAKEARERVAVIATSIDAAAAKLGAVRKGYWDDPFARYFVSEDQEPLTHAPPLFNRGTTTRVAGIDCVVRLFLEHGGRQVVSLGGGSDTTYARLRHGGAMPDDALWAEVDFPEVAAAKNARIAAHPELRSAFGGRYAMRGVDLRDVDALKHVLVDELGVDTQKPTLFLSEIVLVYMDAEAGDRIIEWAGRAFACSMFVTLEHIRPDDAFGRTMVEHIAERGCPLRSIAAYGTPEKQQARYAARGFDTASSAFTMNDAYARMLPPGSAAARHVASLEILDEVEEWHLLQDHYCFVVALHDPHSTLRIDRPDALVFRLPFTPKPASMLPEWNRHGQQQLPQHPVLGAAFCHGRTGAHPPALPPSPPIA